MLTALLARWQAPDEFGAFSVAFATWLVASGFYNALMLEPATVLGPSRWRDSIADYLHALPELHAALTVPVAAAGALPLMCLAALNPSHPLPRALLAAFLTMPFMLAIWLARRINYIERRTHWAAAANLAYASIVAIGVVFLHRQNNLTAVAVLFVVALASFVAALPTFVRVTLHRPGPHRPSVTELAREHWKFGHWIVWSAGLTAFTYQAPAYLTASILGLGRAGAFRAVTTAATPISQILVALTSLALPSLSALYRDRDLASIVARARLVASVCVGIASVNAMVMIAFHARIERMLFGGRYHADAALIGVVAIFPIFNAVGVFPSLVLRSVRHTRHFLMTSLVMAPLTVAVFATMTVVGGLRGASWALVVITAFSVVPLRMILHRWLRSNGHDTRFGRLLPVRP